MLAVQPGTRLSEDEELGAIDPRAHVGNAQILKSKERLIT